jgi:MFS family permease
MDKRLLRDMSSNIILLGIVSFITDTSSDMMWPILPMFITSIGGTGLAIGLISGLAESIASILKVFSGYWSDKIGKRKPLVALGYTISSTSKLFFPLITTWQHLLLLKPLERFGKGIRTAPRDGIIADSATKNARGKGFGIHRAMDTSGAILGSILAFTLFWFLSLQFKTIFLIAAAIAFLALLPLIFVKETKTKPKQVSLTISLKGLKTPLKLFILIATIFALGNFSYMFFILKAQETFQPLFPEKMAKAMPILLYALFNISYALLSIPIGTLSDKIGRRHVLATGYFLFALTCFGFIFSHSLTSLIILFLLYGLFYAFVDGVQRACASDLTSKKLTGTALGAFHTSISLAALPASLIAGFLWDICPETTFIYGTLMGFAASALLIINIKDKSATHDNH